MYKAVRNQAADQEAVMQKRLNIDLGWLGTVTRLTGMITAERICVENVLDFSRYQGSLLLEEDPARTKKM